MVRKVKLSTIQKRIKKLALRGFPYSPTFLEYFIESEGGCVCYKKKGYYWIEIDEGWLLIPPIPVMGNNSPPIELFEDYKVVYSKIPLEGYEEDYEFVFTPQNYLSLAGRKKRTIRKKINKFEALYKDEDVRIINKKCVGWLRVAAWNLYLEWLAKRKEGEKIWDYPYVSKILTTDNDLWCMVLLFGKKPVGFNIYEIARDSSGMWANFIASKTLPDYAGTYIRVKLFQHLAKLGVDEVYDTGTLQNPNLERFKNELIPSRKSLVYTYVSGGDEE